MKTDFYLVDLFEALLAWHSRNRYSVRMWEDYCRKHS